MEGVNVTGPRDIIHFCCLLDKAGFYSDVAECLPVNPATQVQYPDGTGWGKAHFINSVYPDQLASKPPFVGLIN